MIFRCFFLIIFLFIAQKSIAYQFLFAGHAYGDHKNNNTGLHPPFVKYLQNNALNFDFMLFGGDMSRSGSKENLKQITKQLNIFKGDIYYALGNHDYRKTWINLLTQQYGNTYYHFKKDQDLFFILDTEKERFSITDYQIKMIRNAIASNSNIKNVFIIMHELLWQKDPKYKHIYSNLYSRHDTLIKKKSSNFWLDLHPIVKENNAINFHVLAGDLGGQPDGISAFFEEKENLKLIAVGMGDAPVDMMLIVKSIKGQITFTLKDINTDELLNLEAYNLSYHESNIWKHYITRFLVDHKRWWWLLVTAPTLLFLFYLKFRSKAPVS